MEMSKELHDLFTVVFSMQRCSCGTHVLYLVLSHSTVSPLPLDASPLPVDDTRVKLLDEENDYINANHVTVRTLFKSESMAASCLSRRQFVPHRLTASESRMPTLNLTL